jgi:hypothetical protein
MKEMCSLCSYGSGVEMHLHSKKNSFKMGVLKNIATYCMLKCYNQMDEFLFCKHMTVHHKYLCCCSKYELFIQQLSFKPFLGSLIELPTMKTTENSILFATD